MSTNAYGAPWVVRAGDAEYKFPLLKMKQMAVLQAVIQAERSEVARRLALEHKLKLEEVVRSRSLVELAGMDIGVIRSWVISPAGIQRTLEESLTGNPAAAEILASLDYSTLEEAALRVTGWTPPNYEKPTLVEALKAAGWSSFAAADDKFDVTAITDALKAAGWKPPVEKLEKPNPTSADAK
jgi:hypothetical protein